MSKKVTTYKTFKGCLEAIRSKTKELRWNLDETEREILESDIQTLIKMKQSYKRLENCKPKNCFRRFKNNARNNNIPFNLDWERVKDYSYAPCATCGHIASQTEAGWIVEREDDSKGYKEDNIKPSCYKCSYKKRVKRMRGEMNAK